MVLSDLSCDQKPVFRIFQAQKILKLDLSIFWEFLDSGLHKKDRPTTQSRRKKVTRRLGLQNTP